MIAKFRTLKKSAHLVLMQSLEKAIWNWMDTYPQEFIDLQKNSNEELTKERWIYKNLELSFSLYTIHIAQS